MTDDVPLLEVTALEKYFQADTGVLSTLFGSREDPIRAVDDVSFTVKRNDAMGIVGESGCGKTTLLMTLIGLETPTSGQIRFRGQDMATFTKAEWKDYRRNVQIIFQDPFNSHDPKFTVRKSLLEQTEIHDIDDPDERIHRVLEQVELEPAEKYLDRQPEQLSGGELQRLSIARALIVEPSLLLADEPVSMLDVSTQASILNLLSNLIEQEDMSLIYISHDLSTVSYVCESISVMYLGRIVEIAPTLELLAEPKHPYSQALINAIPIPDPTTHRERTRIEGAPKIGRDTFDGCRFRDRCPERMEICERTPDLVAVEDHEVACHLYYDATASDDRELSVSEAEPS